MIQDQIKSTDWHNTIAPTRALLQTVEEPLFVLWELFQANERALAALEPALGLVDFAPFAQLNVSHTDPQPAQPQPAPRRSTSRVPVPSSLPTAGPPPIPASAQATRRVATIASPNFAKADATPVFALPGRKSATAAVTSAATSCPTAQPLAFVAHQPGDEAAHINPASAWQGDQPTIVPPTAQRALENPTSPAPAVRANESKDRGAPVETMALLATLTDALFTLPMAKGSVVGDDQYPTREKSQDIGEPRPFSAQSPSPSLAMNSQGQTHPASSLAFAGGNTDHALAIPSFAPATRSTALSSLAETLPRASLDDGWPADSPSATAAALSQPDGWTLAQLINDVLAEEARRHGVDLS